MSVEAALREPRRRLSALRVVAGTVAKGDTAEDGLIAISHELNERLTAIGNYLAAASRLREIEPAAVFASHSGEIVQKALGQVREAGRATRQLRRVLSTGNAEASVPPRLPQKANPAYRVHFFNEFARGGSVIRACQRTITIRSARNPERVVEAAKRRFARIEGIRDWHIHAQIVELEVFG